ncbi:MAG: hypothetical protein HQL52_16520 [Magnetococcales bacterium]|nr:hypothetical protein [Magnetococcales bacterium]
MYTQTATEQNATPPSRFAQVSADWQQNLNGAGKALFTGIATLGFWSLAVGVNQVEGESGLILLGLITLVGAWWLRVPAAKAVAAADKKAWYSEPLLPRIRSSQRVVLFSGAPSNDG